MTTVAVLDANVLNPNALCARASVGRACHIPVPPAAIERRIAFMNAAFEDALVTGYESLIDQMDNAPKFRLRSGQP